MGVILDSMKRPFKDVRPIGPFSNNGEVFKEGAEYIFIAESTGAPAAINDAIVETILDPGNDSLEFDIIGDISGNRDITDSVVRGTIVEATTTDSSTIDGVRNTMMRNLDKTVRGDIVNANIVEY